MTRAVDKFTMPKRYDLISSVIRNNILSGRLPPGFVLLEGPIANLTQSSRAPVQAALRILEKERLVRRFHGRGYLVARDGEQVEPLRRDIREIDLQISGEIDEALQNRGMWEMVYDTVEDAVASCLIFGEFRIIETELGDHLGVSRTVVRDVLSRLHESGLIRKNQSSHWIAGPLTAASVRNLFDIRSILEPAALRMAGPYIDYGEIERMLRTLDRSGIAPEAETLEQVLMDACITRAPNPELVDVITRNRMPLIAANRALTRLGLPRDRIAMRDYTSLFGLLAQKQINPAAELLARLSQDDGREVGRAAEDRRHRQRVQHHRAVPHANPPELIFPRSAAVVSSLARDRGASGACRKLKHTTRGDCGPWLRLLPFCCVVAVRPPAAKSLSRREKFRRFGPAEEAAAMPKCLIIKWTMNAKVISNLPFSGAVNHRLPQIRVFRKLCCIQKPFLITSPGKGSCTAGKARPPFAVLA